VGQAFDEKGNVLGEAHGATKAEVAKILEDKFGDRIDRMEIQRAKETLIGGPSPEPILQFFEFAHLPEELRAVSAPFGVLAKQVVENLPRNPERTVALRKLLEAKDAAVRAVLFKG
jgi:hypothetical protein